MATNNKKPLIIIGGSGHGCVIEACIKSNLKNNPAYEWDLKGYCNDFETEIDGYPVLGRLSDIPRFVEEGYYFAWAIHLIAKNVKTTEVFNSLVIPTERWATIIHHTAFIDDTVVLEPGVFVMANAYIAPRTHIGMCTMVKANTNIGHDVKIGALSHIAMGSTIVSCVEIGYCADVAVSSTVLANTKIGDYAMLGAASLLTHNIPDGQIWVGSPACYLKDMEGYMKIEE